MPSRCLVPLFPPAFPFSFLCLPFCLSVCRSCRYSASLSPSVPIPSLCPATLLPAHRAPLTRRFASAVLRRRALPSAPSSRHRRHLAVLLLALLSSGRHKVSSLRWGGLLAWVSLHAWVVCTRMVVNQLHGCLLESSRAWCRPWSLASLFVSIGSFMRSVLRVFLCTGGLVASRGVICRQHMSKHPQVSSRSSF